MVTTHAFLDKRDWPRKERSPNGFASHQKNAFVVGVVVTDVLLVVVLAILLHFLKDHTTDLSLQYLVVVALGATLFSYATLLQRGYQFDSFLRCRQQVVTVAASAAVTFLTIIVVLSKVVDELSRVWLISWPAAVEVALAAERVLIYRSLTGRRLAGGLAARLAIVGRDQCARDLAARISAACRCEADVCGWFSAGPLHWGPNGY